jgi:hypothetical protein
MRAVKRSTTQIRNKIADLIDKHGSQIFTCVIQARAEPLGTAVIERFTFCGFR